MDRRPWKARRLVRATTLTCTIAVLTLAFVPAASESSTQNRLFAFVVPTNRGPLPACSPGTCTLANNVNHFVYVLNANGLKHVLQGGGRTRPEVANAFVVSSVDWSIFVDGVDTFDFTATPPPDAGEFFFWSGHWVSTVGCRPAPPCSEVVSPAILPGENTAVFYTGWTHAVGEPNGTYVFRYTVHGTLNGAPVDLTASSPPIEMTD
jgi:hypothetical protein